VDREAALRAALARARAESKGCSFVIVPLLWLAHTQKHGPRPRVTASFDDAMRDWSRFFPDWNRWARSLANVIPADLGAIAGRHVPLLFASDSLGTVDYISAENQERLLDLAFHGNMQLATAISRGINDFIHSKPPPVDSEATSVADRDMDTAISMLTNEFSKPAPFEIEATLLGVADSDGGAAQELGMLYLQRRDVPLAMRYFEIAHNLGNGEAAYVLASLILDRNFERRDRAELEKARALLEHAARGGDTRTRPNLALVMYWLDPSNMSLKERVERIFGERAREAEKRQEEIDRIQDICESGDAERRVELARLEVMRKAAKREQKRLSAERSLAKTAAHVQQQNRIREESRRYDAATPQNEFDTFFDDFDALVAGDKGEDASIRAPRSPPQFLNIYGPTAGSGDEERGAMDTSHDSDINPASDPSHGENPPERLPAPGPSIHRSGDESAMGNDSGINPSDPSHGESPAERRSAPGTHPVRARERRSAPSIRPVPPPAPAKRGRGRPKGSRDTKPRAAYGSKKTAGSGRGPGRPLGTTDATQRKRKTKVECTRNEPRAVESEESAQETEGASSSEETEGTLSAESEGSD
jgi:hypothetical protein